MGWMPTEPDISARRTTFIVTNQPIAMTTRTGSATSG